MREESKNFLVVDSGHLLFDPHTNPTNVSELDLITAHGIARAYGEIGYDGIGVSSSDLRAGTEFFRPHSSSANPAPQWLSANSVGPDGTPVVAPYRYLQIDSLRVAIIGLTGPAPGTLANGIRITDWREALRGILKDLRNQCDLFVVLSSLTPLDNEELAASYTDIDLVVSSYPDKSKIPPRQAHNTLATQAGNRGKSLGRMDIVFHPAGSWLVEEGPTLDTLRRRLAAIDWQIGRMTPDNTNDAQAGDRAIRLQRMRDYRQKLVDMVEAKSKALADRNDPAAISNTFDVSFLPIVPGSSGGIVDAIVAETKMSISGYSRLQREHLSVAEASAEIQEKLQPGHFGGPESCADCHQQQHQAWRNGNHAKAFTTLVEQGQQFNPDCLPCHVTAGGIDETSPDNEKMYLLVLPPQRQGVTCESCHGPALAHSKSGKTPYPLTTPTEQSCRRCHTTERDPEFDFTERLHGVGCRQAATHSE